MQLPPNPAKLANRGFCENAYFRAYATAFSLMYGFVASIIFLDSFIVKRYTIILYKKINFVKKTSCNEKKYGV